jgi:PiT family inorganic phosphate transporter
VAKAGLPAITWGAKWVTTLSFIAVSPVVGLLLSSSLMIVMAWVFRWTNPHRVNRFFRHAQLVGSASLSLAHGANDAQKTMGIIMGLLVATQNWFASETGILRHLHVTSFESIPYWVEIGAYTAIAMGTLFGGWRIVHTMGSRVTRLRPVGGFCADTGGAISILLATRFGIPVSTTHTITGAIVGVGAVIRVRAVRWDVAGRIVWAWIMTIPAAALMAALSYFILAALIKL